VISASIEISVDRPIFFRYTSVLVELVLLAAHPYQSITSQTVSFQELFNHENMNKKLSYRRETALQPV